jgi:formylglycine-generating enzyme required for sulfatase activity
MALALDSARTGVRDDMARLLWAHAALAETARDKDGAADLVRRLAAYDPIRAASWHAPGHLGVTSAPDAKIVVSPIVDRRGYLVVGPPAAQGRGTVTVTMPQGSYMIECTATDGLVVRAPTMLVRDERRSLDVPLPPRSAIPEGYVYVPAGEVLLGSDHDDFMRRDFLSAAPLHTVRTDAFLIGRHEVTFAEWITFLDALPTADQEQRRPATRGGAVMTGQLVRDHDDWAIALKPGSVPLAARRGELLRYPDRELRSEVHWERLPVSGIDLDDARAYARWLDVTKRVPGARLCHEREWERAARGADDRPYPHGSVVERDDANLDHTYARRSYGPDEVGSHPVSNSPFGIADMLGNVWEWVDGSSGPLTRGGGWYYGPSSALIANRDAADPAMRELVTGLRICARAPSAR